MSTSDTSPAAPQSLSSRIPLSSGHGMPVLGLGTWRSAPGAVESAVKAALLAGYRHIDGAWTYGNEAEVGAGIAQAIAASHGALTRADLFITSKVWNNQLLADDVAGCCRDSLAKLGTPYLDLYLIHWPIAFKRMSRDDATHNKFAENDKHTDRYYEWADLEDTWRAMERLVDEGLVRAIGLSNHSIAQCQRVLGYARIRPVTNQVECHPFLNQRRLLAYLTSQHMTLTAYSPLGNVARDAAEAARSPLNDAALQAMAQRLGRTVAQVVLRWHLQRGCVPVPKSVTESRIVENGDVFGFVLSGEDMAAIDAMGEGEKRHRFINPPFLPRMRRVFDETDEREKAEGASAAKQQQQQQQ